MQYNLLLTLYLEIFSIGKYNFDSEILHIGLEMAITIHQQKDNLTQNSQVRISARCAK